MFLYRLERADCAICIDEAGTYRSVASWQVPRCAEMFGTPPSHHDKKSEWECPGTPRSGLFPLAAMEGHQLVLWYQGEALYFMRESGYISASDHKRRYKIL